MSMLCVNFTNSVHLLRYFHIFIVIYSPHFMDILSFHELRVHFIESNNLPPKFKVSHYLKRSLTTVLLDFVHISSYAWILLMATANLLYFLSGMILSVTGTSLDVEEFLMYIVFALMVIFVAFAFVLYFKMKSIFSNILHMKLTLYDRDTASRIIWRGSSSSGGAIAVDQEALFWWNNPHLIIVITQYMQFGYALGLAIIFTYYKDFAQSYNIVDPNVCLAALLLSYVTFLSLVSVIIPWYTLCTSMGQLVNKERLNETLAKLKLSEEIRKNETMEEERKAQKEIERRKQEVNAKIEAAAVKSSSKTYENGSQNLGPRKKESSRLLSIFRDRSSDALDIGPSVCSGQMKGSFDEGPKATRSWLRHTRGKSLSDGVQFMTTNACLHGDILQSGSSSPTGSSRLSAAAAEQLNGTDDEPAQLDGSQDEARHLSQGRRHSRKKSISDNVALMKSVNTTDLFSLENTVPHDEEELPKRISVDMARDVGQRVDNSGKSEYHSRLLINSLQTPMRSICETGAENLVSKQPEQLVGKLERKQRRRLMKAQSEGVAMMRMSIATEPKGLSLDIMAKGNKPNTLATLSELTQLSTKVRISISACFCYFINAHECMYS